MSTPKILPPSPPSPMICQWHNARGPSQLRLAALGKNIAQSLLTDHWVWGGGGCLSRIILPTIVWKSEEFFFSDKQKFTSNTAFLLPKTYFNDPITPFNSICWYFYPILCPFCTLFGTILSNMLIFWQYSAQSAIVQHFYCSKPASMTL